MTEISNGRPRSALPYADIVLRNGPIWFGREAGVVEALAVCRGLDEILHHTRCDLTILGGKLVYGRAGDTAEARRREDSEAQ
jgi:hypothetical protein